MNNKTGILIVGHGSKLPYNKDVVSTLAKKYDKRSNNIVESAFMELVEPNIAKQVNKLKNDGVNKIIVFPAFLSHGIHTKVDIPTILGLDVKNIEHHHHHHHHREAKSEIIDFDGKIKYLEPIGADDKVVDIIEEKISTYLDYEKITTSNTGILLIGHGSSLPYGKEVLNTILSKYKERIANYPIELAFMRIEHPSIPESFKKLQENDLENIIVLPVFLADGLHTKSDIPSTLGLDAMKLDFSYPKKEKQVDFDGNIIYLTPIGAYDKLVDLIEDKVEEYL